MEYLKVKEQVGEMLQKSIVFQDEENLLEKGLNSLQIMRLANQWRKQGVKLSFGELMEEPTFTAWWKLLQKHGKANGIQKQEKINAVKVNEPFALTEVQYAYWIGRGNDQTLGGVGCHAYLEFDGENVEAKRLEKAWNLLQYHHPMLRARFLDNGMQEIMKKPYSEQIQVYDFSNANVKEVEMELISIREKLSHRKLCVEKGEVAGISLSLLPNNKTRIHLDIDLLIADVQSLQILLRDLATAYVGNQLANDSKDWNFSAYLEQQTNEEKEEKKIAKEYWINRLEKFPRGPELPLDRHSEEVKSTKFYRRIIKLEKTEWIQLQRLALDYKTTPAMLLLTAYVTVLERWSKNKRFLLNIPLFNRKTGYEGVEDVIADFTTLLLLEVDCEGNPTFLELLRRIQKQLYQDMKHSAYSGVQVQRDLAQLHGGHQTVAPIVFACNLGTPLVNQCFREQLGEFSYMISQTPQVWLDFQTYENDEGLMLTWDSVDELFPSQMIEDMMKSFEKMLHQLSNKDWNQVFDVLPEKQRRVIDIESRVKELINPKCLHQAFLEWADKQPNEVAIVDTEKKLTLTYGELKDRVLTVASAIIRRGITKEAIAITLPRGLEQIEAALAILVSDNYYVPVNINQPEERRNMIHEKTGIKYVITTQERCLQSEWCKNVTMLSLEQLECEKKLDDYPMVSPDDTAYIIMTSGSTGLPKGVEIAHKSAWNTIVDINEKYKMNSNDAIIAISAMDFDLSVYDVYGILGVGGKLVTIPENEAKNPDFWIKHIVEQNVTIWNSVPILLEMLVVCAKSKRVKNLPLRLAFLSGDWIPMDLPQKFYEIDNKCLLVSLGGATEGSIWSNYQEVKLPLPNKWKTIPYGRPLKNQTYRIVDEFGRDCPYWVEGELWIGGQGVAKGYKGDEELTNKKFVVDRLGRWYRTGDDGRMWDDNTIEFCGRKDFQVKVKGHRIELGEVETAINKVIGVKESVACAIGHDSRKNMLVAVIARSDENLNIEYIITDLRKKLPEYMIPVKIFFMDRLPVTNNGKRNRNEIANWINKNLNHESKVSRQPTDVERKVIEIWQNLFKSRNIGMADNFFNCGGDSLMAVKMSTMIQEKLSVKISLDAIFKNSTVERLAEIINSSLLQNSKQTPILHSEKGRYEPFPTTEMQYAYWVGRQGIYLLGNVSSYCYYEVLVNNLDTIKLEQSWNTLIQEHDAMRLSFSKDGREQRVLPTVKQYVFEKYDFSHIEYDNNQNEIVKIRDNMAQQIMDASKWPLFDIRLSHFKGNKTVVHIGIDNMIMDARSVLSILYQWTQYYEKGTAEHLKHVFSYRDFVCANIEQKKENVYIDDKKYWLKKTKDFPKCPNLYMKCEPQMLKQQKFQRVSKNVDKEVWRKVKDIARLQGITPANILLAVYAASLYRVSGSQSFALNITIDQRGKLSKELENVIGDFTGNLLLAIELTDDYTFLQFAKCVQNNLIEDMSHCNFTGLELQRELSKVDEKKYILGTPYVFTSTLGMENQRLFGEVTYNITQTPQVWLDHQIQERDEILFLNWDYLKGLFSSEVIDALVYEYIYLLENIAKNEENLICKKVEYKEGML